MLIDLTRSLNEKIISTVINNTENENGSITTNKSRFASVKRFSPENLNNSIKVKTSMLLINIFISHLFSSLFNWLNQINVFCLYFVKCIFKDRITLVPCSRTLFQILENFIFIQFFIISLIEFG